MKTLVTGGADFIVSNWPLFLRQPSYCACQAD